MYLIEYGLSYPLPHLLVAIISLTIEILCQWPSDPINGYIWEKNNCVNTTIVYKCNNGYNVTGDGQRTCKENGHWE